MYHEHDFWFWSETFLKPDVIKDINKTINEKYYQVEDKNDGAIDRYGKYLKNIEPKPYSLIYFFTCFFIFFFTKNVFAP